MPKKEVKSINPTKEEARKFYDHLNLRLLLTITSIQQVVFQ